MDSCPACDAAIKSQCKCLIGDRKCVAGHCWVYCPVHPRVAVFIKPGVDSHAVGYHLGECICGAGRKSQRDNTATDNVEPPAKKPRLSLNEELAQHVLEAWAKRIKDAMMAGATSRVSFTMGEADGFEGGEIEFIKTRLFPYLKTEGLGASILFRGTSSSCDCNAMDCQHGSGRELIVTLV
jgi:hypothetical protein